MADWSDREVRALMDGIGGFGWSAITRRCGGRSKSAIQKKIQREFGGGGITRGTYSLAQAVAETGYHASQLRRASEALNQRWSRTAKGGNYLISAEQLEECAAWLCHDYWCSSLELYGCDRCGSDTKPHFSFGLCQRCYYKLYQYARKQRLPFTAAKLLDIVVRLMETKPKKARLLDSMKARLEMGKPLTKEDLLELAGLL